MMMLHGNTLSYVVYGLMVLMVMYASNLQLRSQELMHRVSTEVTQALRLTALTIMEQGELGMMEREAFHDESMAVQYEQEANYLSHRAKSERIYGVRSRTRGQYFKRIADIDTQQANVSYHKVILDDNARLELLHNLTEDESELSSLDQEERDEKFPFSHICKSWSFFESFCSILGGVPDLIHVRCCCCCC
jgi:hypothetical protein